MEFTPGSTKCPHCDASLFLTDDLFTVEDLIGLNTSPNFQPGIYHHNCFLKTPFKDTYMNKKEEHVLKGFEEHRNDLPLIHIDDHFALIYNRFTGEYRLFFLKHGRDYIFPGKEHLQQLYEQVKSDQSDVDDSLHNRKIIAVKHDANWAIVHQSMVLCDFHFTYDDFEKLALQVNIESAQHDTQKVDLADACRHLDIKPIIETCPIQKAIGVIHSVKSNPGIKLVIIKMITSKEMRVVLTPNEKSHLAHFLSKAVPENNIIPF